MLVRGGARGPESAIRVKENQSDTFTINTAHCGLRGNSIQSMTNRGSCEGAAGPWDRFANKRCWKAANCTVKGLGRGQLCTAGYARYGRGNKERSSVARFHRTDESHQSGTLRPKISGLRVSGHPANRHVKSQKPSTTGH